MELRHVMEIKYLSCCFDTWVDNEIKQKVLVMFPVSQQCLKLNTELPRESGIKSQFKLKMFSLDSSKTTRPRSHSSRTRLSFLYLCSLHYTVMRVKSAFYNITKLTQPNVRRTKLRTLCERNRMSVASPCLLSVLCDFGNSQKCRYNMSCHPKV